MKRPAGKRIMAGQPGQSLKLDFVSAAAAVEANIETIHAQ